MVELQTVGLFCGLNHKELWVCAKLRGKNGFRRARKIFREGDTGDGLYVIKDGPVQIAAHGRRKARRVFSQLGPGEIFGEMAVIEDLPRSATATALTDTRVYFIPREEMRALLATFARPRVQLPAGNQPSPPRIQPTPSP